MRADYAAVETIVSGVRQAFQASAAERIDVITKIREINHALDNFCDSHSSVASGIQPAHRWRINSSAAGCGAGRAGH